MHIYAKSRDMPCEVGVLPFSGVLHMVPLLFHPLTQRWFHLRSTSDLSERPGAARPGVSTPITQLYPLYPAVLPNGRVSFSAPWRETLRSLRIHGRSPRVWRNTVGAGRRRCRADVAA